MRVMFVYIDEDLRAFDCEADFRWGLPACTSGPADGWRPSEPAELEVLSVKRDGVEQIERLDESELEQIERYGLDRVAEAASDG